jgi:hypothetical protein
MTVGQLGWREVRVMFPEIDPERCLRPIQRGAELRSGLEIGLFFCYAAAKHPAPPCGRFGPVAQPDRATVS